jgi:hypothetical protein
MDGALLGARSHTSKSSKAVFCLVISGGKQCNTKQGCKQSLNKKCPQFIMGVLAQVENGSKQFWK